MTGPEMLQVIERRKAVALAKVGIQLAVIVAGLFVIAHYLLLDWAAGDNPLHSVPRSPLFFRPPHRREGVR